MALWRETLLAKKVLEGNTKGYRNHTQLIRFRTAEDPLALINLYLVFILEEAERRGYRFNQEKVNWESCEDCELRIEVSGGQMEYERQHLLAKLRVRDFSKYEELVGELELAVHPVFELVEGEIEEWEKI